jgi:hypothetical protein
MILLEFKFQPYYRGFQAPYGAILSFEEGIDFCEKSSASQRKL